MHFWLLSFSELWFLCLNLSLWANHPKVVFSQSPEGALWSQLSHTVKHFHLLFFFLSACRLFTQVLGFHWWCTYLSLIWLMVLEASFSLHQFHVRLICSSNALHSAGMLIFRLLLILLQRKLPASSPLPCSSLQLQSPIVCLSDCCADCALTLKPPSKTKRAFWRNNGCLYGERCEWLSGSAFKLIFRSVREERGN